MNDKMPMKSKIALFLTLLALTGCQTIGGAKPVPIAVAPPTTGASISGGGLVGGDFGGALAPSDRQLALNAEYKSLEYGKAGEAVDWAGAGGVVSGKVKAAQPYRVGSQDCRQYSHEILANGATKAVRGTACRNNDGSWNLLE